MNRRVLPKYCLSIAKVVFTSLTKLVHISYPKWLGECSSLRTQRCKNNLVRHPHLQESHLVSHMEAPCFCRQIWSSILQRGIIGAPCSESTLTSWVVFLCRALIASFLSRSTLTSIEPTNGQFLICSFSSQVEQVIHTKPCTNITIAKAALHMLPGKSSLNVRSVCPVPVCPVCPGFPICPDDHDDHDEHDYNDNHNHDNHDNQFCTFTFWQQRAL